MTEEQKKQLNGLATLGKEFFEDDKLHIIWTLGIIAVVAMFKIPESVTIVSSVVAGLLGIAVGKAIK